MFESKILIVFGTFTNQTVLICYIRISDMLNQKILLVFGAFTNRTVLIYCIRISDMLETKILVFGTFIIRLF